MLCCVEIHCLMLIFFFAIDQLVLMEPISKWDKEWSNSIKLFFDVVRHV